MSISCSCSGGVERALGALEIGEGGIVSRVVDDSGLKRKVLEMGLVPGTQIRVERKAPLGDPISVWFRGYELSLRLDEANAVFVRPAGCAGCPGAAR